MELRYKYLVDMEVIKRLYSRLSKWEYFWLCLLLVITLVLHFSVIYRPAEPIFDEQHYVPDARNIIRGNGTQRPEHPPLAKLIIAGGILLFGDNPLGWRFFSVLFGTVTLIFFYLICRELGLSKRATVLATFLLSLENLSFVQASVAMLDVYSLTFTMVAFWLYLKEKYLTSGVAVALSALAKLYGGLAAVAIFIHWAGTRFSKRRKFIASLVLTPVAFLVLLTMTNFVISKQFTNPLSLVKEMLELSASITFATTTHSGASRPWEWVLLPKMVPYWYNPNYLGVISYTVWALIIPVMVYLGFLSRKGNQAGAFGVSWIAGTYLLWIPTVAISNRISFPFYFYPTVGAICIGLGMGLSWLIDFGRSGTGKLRRAVRIAVPSYLVLHVIVFFILAPITNVLSAPIVNLFEFLKSRF